MVRTRLRLAAPLLPVSSDEVHYDATPAFEKAYAWVSGLQARPFVGTESRLHTGLDLLRQIVHGTETDADSRLALLRGQRGELDRQIAQAEAVNVPVLTDTAVRERYQAAARPRTMLTATQASQPIPSPSASRR